MHWEVYLYYFIVFGFLLYSIALVLIYGWIGWYAKGANNQYILKNNLTDYSLIGSSLDAPSFSLIAPAYNEGATIVENVRSLLSLYYTNFEIIIVNDGSKDDSLQRLIDAYNLYKIDYLIEGNLKTNKVKAIYKSSNPVFKKLIVVDKENGGKSDALNVGINISTKDYIVCIDVDCILEQDAILKLAKPFIDDPDYKIIACGGVIRLANNCEIVNGKITKVRLPKTLLGKFQALEYIRAFILGRMAWSRINGLILISGAFGAFDRKIVLACGGYDHNTVGEDMELVVRMRRYMHEQNVKYKVVNIPDPLCWTEVPEDKTILSRQRNRWMRGTIETLYKHRKLFFNPNYGKLGMISYPYWFFFEFLGPVVEFFGFLVFFIFVFFGIINWPIFFALLAFVLLYGILYSIYAILVDITSYNVYYKTKDIPKLVLTAFLEPFLFHPKIVWASVNGIKDYFLKNSQWGEMTRQGFASNTQNEITLKQKLALGFIEMLKNTTLVSLVYFIFAFVSTIGEYYFFKQKITEEDSKIILTELIAKNTLFAFKAIFVVSTIYYLLQFYNQLWAKRSVEIIYATLIIGNFSLINYFNTTLVLLGADLFSYSIKEIILIIGASGVVTITNVVIGGLAITFISWLFIYFNKKKVSNKWALYPLFALSFLMSFVNVDHLEEFKQKDEFLENLTQSKSGYFYSKAFNHLVINRIEEIGIPGLSETGETVETRIYVDAINYPFLYKDDSKDFLGPKLKATSTPPNIVYIIVEGLGRAYSNQNAYLGSFTPFLDELSKKSLYWENGLSSAGRTFGALPSISGSLPFGETGFMELKDYPKHLNLINLLNSNGYNTGFFYGGDSEFDNMKRFLEFSHIGQIIDENNYAAKYKRIPSNSDFSWGYDDQSLLENYFNYVKDGSDPYFNIILTLATHSPFLLNDAAKFKQRFDQHIKTLPSDKVSDAKKYEKQLTTFLSVDDALKTFFETYKKRKDYQNTIFVITGDHRIPEIPMSTKIDRFHVPIMVYSPLLKESAKMSNIVSHFDITPTIATYLRDTQKLNFPHYVTWMGSSLGNGKSTYRVGGIPLMQNKNSLDDFVIEDHHIVEDVLFKISNNLNEDNLDENGKYKELKNRLTSFKKKNHSLLVQQKMVPDSLLNKYLK